MKKIYWLLIIIILIIGILFIFFVFRNSSQSSKNTVVDCALKLYNEKKSEGMIFSSQCLGNCFDYAVDIVHVPRTSEDNKIENQCEDYRTGKVKHFIELDSKGNVVRIV